MEIACIFNDVIGLTKLSEKFHRNNYKIKRIPSIR